MKKKILIVSSWYPSEESPINGCFVQDQAIVLSKKYDVSVLFLHIPGWRSLLKRKILPKSHIEYHDNLIVFSETILLPPNILFSYRKLLLKKIILHRFKKIISRWGFPDLIHSHVVWAGGWAAVNIAKKYKIPVVLTEHSGPFSMHLKSKSQRKLVRKILNEVDKIVAVSPALADQILSFYKSKTIDIVGNVIRALFFEPGYKRVNNLSQSKIKFLSVATLNEQKGIQYLIKAGHHLNKQGILSFEIIIAGDGPMRSDLESMANNLGIADNCKFLGLVAHNDIRDLMQLCDVFVLPSLAETFSVVVAEAMACGKPVIATRCGGPEFIVEEGTGLLVNIADHKELAEAMYKFINKQIKFDENFIRYNIFSRFGEDAFLYIISSIYEDLWKR